MLHSLGLGEIQDIDSPEELERENIHLLRPFDSVSTGVFCDRGLN
jgi:hypothetical protein